MLRDIIDQVLYDSGIKKYYCDFIDNINGMTLEGNIIIDQKLKHTYKDNSTTWHEYFHVLTCPYHLAEAPKLIQDKFERLAEQKTAEQCLPIDTVIELYEYGARTLEDFSEALELDTQYICSTLKQYQDKHGYNYRHGSYMVESFAPLSIRRLD